MIDVASTFILGGIFLGIGFLADLVFERTGIPDLLVMIFLGVTVGPILGLVEQDPLLRIAPFFAALAVAAILFDAGLNLRLRQVLSESPRALILAFLGVAASILVTAVFTSLFLGWSIVDGVLLGSIIGGPCSAFVTSLVRRVNASPKVTTLLSLESVFTDAIVVVVAITIMQFLANPEETPSISLFTRGIAGAFLIGAVVGVLGGVLWIRLLKTIFEEAYRDILTLGIALLIYGLSESAGGSGAISALTFGMVLGNGREIASKLAMKDVVEAGVVMMRFQRQISFLIRTFFFAFLGMIFVVREPSLLLAGLIISMFLLAGRYLAIRVSTYRAPILQMERPLMTTMIGRGLAAAVLANLATGYGVKIASALRELTLEVIVVTVIISAVGIHTPKIVSTLKRKTTK